MNNLDRNVVLFDPASLVDPFGKVFYYQGEVYRAINPEGVAICKKVLNMGKTWEKHGLVKTRKASFSLNGYPLTVWHERIQYKNYCMEWLPSMLKDAALKFLEFDLLLLKNNLTCKDAHPWNIFFNFSKPIFIDIGSIVPYNQIVFRTSIAEFQLYFLLPLVLFERQGIEKTYDFLRQPIPNDQVRKVLVSEIPELKFIDALDFSKPYNVLNELADYILTISVNSDLETQWSGYDQKKVSFEKANDFVLKQRVVYDFLSTLPKGDILDIGCNQGWYSLLAERKGHRVVAIDKDIPSISRLYVKAKKKGLRILTLFIDFQYPTPAHGLDSAYPSFEERFYFDVVLAMAIVHHLAYSSKMNFDEIAGRIATLTKRYAVIEFIPKEDFHVSKWDQSKMEWYNRDNFITAFLKYFNMYKVVASSPDPREVFIFSK